ncbi:aminoacyl-tRNA hydrolase [Corynebacterium liangguodongii]|uniref:Peptidyl-tRNA hydrolase n=1 Tax=Corynebacterium liangguodongii TaxID=2079535 RepID=A0A2S0WD68_9CORY|nr:aminoacyl-tRNA hydrolase [Corynebacterium liangguodongii]AWB83717.1 aminoacyl-tRNA hydrolase [Corynebacterium liangguodongii]PWB99473.1 peptidyl-tRNA hydrolase [Corynebacterium liangguodongii]
MRPDLPQWLVVGLGNPGLRYARTRHNVGFMVVDTLGRSLGETVAVLKPQTYMNNSGDVVAPAARELGLGAERIIVCHDELDLPAGVVRLKQGGNENGHNGLKSITESLGTRDYLRVRIGIGRPPAGVAVPDYVLSPPEGDVSDQITVAAEAVRLLITEGLAKAQNVVHSRAATIDNL